MRLRSSESLTQVLDLVYLSQHCLLFFFFFFGIIIVVRDGLRNLCGDDGDWCVQKP